MAASDGPWCASVQDAYAALQANPVAERRLEALQRLLGALCAAGDVAALLRLPLAGVARVQRNGRCGPAPALSCEGQAVPCTSTEPARW